MARRIICPKCHLEFTPAQYSVHKFAHNRDEYSRRDPVDLPSARLLPIDVPDDSDEAMEDAFEAPAQTTEHQLSLGDDPFADDYENAGCSLPPPDPFSDDHATTSTTILPHDTPFANPSHTFLPSSPSDEDMGSNLSPSNPEDSPAQSPASSQLPPLIDQDLGFEDSGLDPTFSGHPSLSEQLKERFLAGYHGGGKQYWIKYVCTHSLLSIDSEAPV